MSETVILNNLSPKINLTKLPIKQPQHHRLNKDCDWVKVLLLELNENATTKDPEDYIANTSLVLDIIVEKRFEPNLGEYLLLDIKLEALYITTCVKTLEEMQDSLEIEAKCCFIDEHFADAPEYSDQTDIYINPDMYELYFYENRFAELREMLHEQIYLNANQYPTIESEASDSKGPGKETLH